MKKPPLLYQQQKGGFNLFPMPFINEGIPFIPKTGIVYTLLSMFFKVRNSLANCGNGLGLLIRDGDVEFLFEFHD